MFSVAYIKWKCFTYHNFFRFQYTCNFFLVKVLFFFKTVIILGKRVIITSQKNQPKIYTKFILFQSSSLSTWHSLVSQDSWVHSAHLGVLLISLNMGKEFYGLEKEHMKGNKSDRKVQWHLQRYGPLKGIVGTHMAKGLENSQGPLPDSESNSYRWLNLGTEKHASRENKEEKRQTSLEQTVPVKEMGGAPNVDIHIGALVRLSIGSQVSLCQIFSSSP